MLGCFFFLKNDTHVCVKLSINALFLMIHVTFFIYYLIFRPFNSGNKQYIGQSDIHTKIYDK